MRYRKRKFVVSVFTSLAFGVCVYWLIGIILEPKPVLQISLDQNESAMIYLNKLVIHSPRTVTHLDLHNGKKRTNRGDEFRHPTDEPQPKIKKGTEAKALSPNESDGCYLTYPRDRNRFNPGFNSQLVYQIPDTSLFHRFHGYIQDDQFDSVFCQLNRKNTSCVVRRTLPFSFVLANSFSPIQSPAEIVSCQALTLLPSVLHSIISVPDKVIQQQFILDGSWGNAAISIAHDGKKIAFTKAASTSKDGKRVERRIWNVQSKGWIPTHSKLDQLESTHPAQFINKDVLAVVASMPSARGGIGFYLVQAENGHIFDQIHDVTVDYFASQQNRVTDDGSFVYLRTNPSANRNTYRLVKTRDLQTTQTISEAICNSSPLVALAQGYQSIITINPSYQFIEWLKFRVGYYPWVQRLESWMCSPSIAIHDWLTQKTYSVWNAIARRQLSENGEYLLIVHGNHGSKTQQQEILAQVYRMPLKLYSSWWKLGAGIVTGLLCLCLMIYWSMRRTITPNASSSQTVA